jgi:putative transposase
LGDVVETKEKYRDVRARIGQLTGRDRRISTKLYAKYGRREKNRCAQKLHKVTKETTSLARSNSLGIVMEKLTGIRKLFRRGNSQGTSFRGRMNSWPFHELQRQVEYKAAWLGVPVYYVNPRGTSRNCPNCGSHVAPLQGRKLYCLKCDKTWDRDVLASRNIMACLVPQVRPLQGSSEKELGGEGCNPSSRWAEVKPGC